MNNPQTTNHDYEGIAWGMLFIWWGLRWWPLVFLPNGIGLIGTGLILLGLNVTRALKGIPTRSSTTIFGFLALTFGGILLAREILHIPFEVPFFEILLIALGVILLTRGLLRARRAGFVSRANT